MHFQLHFSRLFRWDNLVSSCSWLLLFTNPNDSNNADSTTCRMETKSQCCSNIQWTHSINQSCETLDWAMNCVGSQHPSIAYSKTTRIQYGILWVRSGTISDPYCANTTGRGTCNRLTATKNAPYTSNERANTMTGMCWIHYQPLVHQECPLLHKNAKDMAHSPNLDRPQHLK